MYYSLLITFFSLIYSSCDTNPANRHTESGDQVVREVSVGAAQIDLYLPLLKDKAVGLVVNHTSRVDSSHLVDLLLKHEIDVQAIFAPEHGFRGAADAGEKISDQTDAQTGIPVLSLYGERRKPLPSDLQNLDIVLFDIQDVGARFYTYISTMSLVMEACGEQNLPLVILDRPNPNGHYVDGPIREEEFTSFVGMHPVPIVYGMTMGEYASMVNQEGWLKNGVRCDLSVIPCQNYTHQTLYALPHKPSPNLPNLRSILLYPSLCFFEGTPLSIGRGTQTQFQVIGHPQLSGQPDTFTPSPQPGAQSPKLNGETCYGRSLVSIAPATLHRERRLNLSYVLDFYRAYPDQDLFFNKNGWFDKLAGTRQLREMIQQGKSAQEIRDSWQPDLDRFHQIRRKYLLYPE